MERGRKQLVRGVGGRGAARPRGAEKRGAASRRGVGEVRQRVLHGVLRRQVRATAWG